MKVKVTGSKLQYNKEVYAVGETLEMPAADPCTGVLQLLGRVCAVTEETSQPKKKTSKKTSGTYQRRDVTAEE